MTPERRKIIADYSGWAALSALRSGAPIKSRKDIYPLIAGIDFSQVLDTTKGPITKEIFESWHKETLEALVAATPQLENQYGWAAKILNVYLKTYCYIGNGGREGIRAVLHPPIDQRLWSGVEGRFKNNKSILADSHVVTKIKNIDSHATCLQVIKGLRAASDELGCLLFEVEQLWEGVEEG